MKLAVQEADPRLPYFAWALEQSRGTRMIAEYLSTRAGVDVETVTERLRATVYAELYGWDVVERPIASLRWYGSRFPRQRSAAGSLPDRLLSNPELATAADYRAVVDPVPFGDLRTQLGADEQAAQPAYLQEAAYRLMLIAILASMDGDRTAIEWLDVLMVRGGLNRQLTISRYLGLLTQGRVGSSASMPPAPEEVIKWAQTPAEDLALEPVLAQMVHDYAVYSREDRGEAEPVNA